MPSVPPTNVAELCAYLKANPDKVNFGSSGNGSSQHISAALFNSMAGVAMAHISYRGGAPGAAVPLGGGVAGLFGAAGRSVDAGARRQAAGARHHHGCAIAAVAGCSHHRRN